MATFTITISNNTEAADLRDTICVRGGYSGAPGDNTAKMEFVRQIIMRYLKDEYASQKAVDAAETARVVALVQARLITIT